MVEKMLIGILVYRMIFDGINSNRVRRTNVSEISALDGSQTFTETHKQKR